jgi:hypothetical protein
MVARTIITGCNPPGAGCLDDNGAYIGLISKFGVECDSACALVLAGGARRLVDPKARLSMSSMGQKRLVKSYLDEMAISPALFAALESVRSSVSSSLMRCLGSDWPPARNRRRR